MKKILVADDEENVRALVTATLEDDDYEILQAANGEEALQIAQRERPSVIFLDVNMPKMNGLEVCRQLKQDPRTQMLSIIMLTAKGQDSDIQLGRDVGADDYFVKPFSPLALLSKLEEIMEKG